MAALCGHAAKGLPWLLQLLHAKGLDLNAYDRSGATPLHLCAERNLARYGVSLIWHLDPHHDIAR